MSLKHLEKISMWFLLFLISFCAVYFYTRNLQKATGSATATATLKTPVMLLHNHIWSLFKKRKRDVSHHSKNHTNTHIPPEKGAGTPIKN
jgi:uncharacterized membrane protein